MGRGRLAFRALDANDGKPTGPLFGGTQPVEFTRSELEIIGVPASPATSHARMDSDIGRCVELRARPQRWVQTHNGDVSQHTAAGTHRTHVVRAISGATVHAAAAEASASSISFHQSKESNPMRNSVLPVTMLIAGAVVSACSAADSTQPGGALPMTVSFSTAAPTGAARSTSTSASASVTFTSGTDVLVITKAQLVVARMELARSGASCTSTAAAGDDNMNEHDCAELEVAPTIVSLPVDSSVVSGLSLTVPAGTYSALEAKIRAVRADSDHGAGSAAFLSAHPELAGVSVLVTGTFNGKAFTYTGAPRAEFETSFSPPVVVAATPTNLTVHVDLSSWFKTSSGALIDPASAIGTGANVHAVAENIQRSFRAFRDQNRDGHDDDSGGN